MKRPCVGSREDAYTAVEQQAGGQRGSSECHCFFFCQCKFTGPNMFFVSNVKRNVA